MHHFHKLFPSISHTVFYSPLQHHRAWSTMLTTTFLEVVSRKQSSTLHTFYFQIKFCFFRQMSLSSDNVKFVSPQNWSKTNWPLNSRRTESEGFSCISNAALHVYRCRNTQITLSTDQGSRKMQSLTAWHPSSQRVKQRKENPSQLDRPSDLRVKPSQRSFFLLELLCFTGNCHLSAEPWGTLG